MASYNFDTEGQGPTALAVGAGGGCLDIFTLIYPFSPLSPSLWETARYRLKYCLKGPLNPKQPTNYISKRSVNIQMGCKLPLMAFKLNQLQLPVTGNFDEKSKGYQISNASTEKRLNEFWLS